MYTDSCYIKQFLSTNNKIATVYLSHLHQKEEVQ